MYRMYADVNKAQVLAFAKQEGEKYLKKMLSKDAELPTFDFVIQEEKGLLYDGFKVSLKEGKLTIISSKARGILYGVYAFLEKLGCSFLFPKEETEVIPSLNALPHAMETFIENPIIKVRGICLYGLSKDAQKESLQTIDWMAKNRYNFILVSHERTCDAADHYHEVLYDEVSDVLAPEIQKRGILIDMSEHSTDIFFPRKELFEQHKEWFSVQNGERVPYQLCYSNEEATDEYARRYAEYAKNRPEIDMIGIWPLDGGGYCECERCKDKYAVVKAINKVARKIHEVRPDLVVEHLAYTPQSFSVPPFEMEDNMCVLVCSKTNDIARQWALKTENKQGAYYFEYNTGDNYRWHTGIFVAPDYCRNIVNRMACMNYEGIVSLFLPIQTWFVGALNYHFMRLAYWDATFDTEKALLELSKSMFGTQYAPAYKALQIISKDIAKPEMWQRYPHWDLDSYDYEFYHKRNKTLDEKHIAYMKACAQNVENTLNALDTSCLTHTQVLYAEYIKAYAHMMQKLHECMDSFDYDTEKGTEKEKVAPLLDYLDTLTQKFGTVFPSKEYATWRLIGRDNLFLQKKYDY